MSILCEKLHHLFHRLERFRFPFDRKRIPKNGIYILFQEGEHAHGGDRIVRIGTHTGTDSLPARLVQHFVREKKDRSIFRKNIGRCLLSITGDPYREIWEYDIKSESDKQKYRDVIIPDKQKQIEKSVTEFIRANFSFCVFHLDELREKDARLRFESKLISTVSHCSHCTPSPDWLGHHSPREKIRRSGLWLVNELYKTQMGVEEIEELERGLFSLKKSGGGS